MWQTPRAIYGEHPGMTDEKHLTGQAIALWPTAVESNHRPGQAERYGPGQRRVLLNDAVAAMWPTATTRDWKDGDAQSCQNVPTNARLGRVVHAAQASTLWSTPRSSDGEKGGPNQKFGAGGQPLPAQACQHSLPAPATPTAGDESSPCDRTSPRPQLNPAFVLWHMGYPDVWLD
jgi:hypothetical protein